MNVNLASYIESNSISYFRVSTIEQEEKESNNKFTAPIELPYRLTGKRLLPEALNSRTTSAFPSIASSPLLAAYEQEEETNHLESN